MLAEFNSDLMNTNARQREFSKKIYGGERGFEQSEKNSQHTILQGASLNNEASAFYPALPANAKSSLLNQMGLKNRSKFGSAQFVLRWTALSTRPFFAFSSTIIVLLVNNFP